MFNEYVCNKMTKNVSLLSLTIFPNDKLRVALRVLFRNLPPSRTNEKKNYLSVNQCI